MNAFKRTFAHRDLFSGPARRAVIWSILATLCLGVWIPSVALLLDLLADTSPLVVRLKKSELAEFNRFTGSHLNHLGPVYDSGRAVNVGDDEVDERVGPFSRMFTPPRPDASAEASLRQEATPRQEETSGRELIGEHQIEHEGLLRHVWKSYGKWYGEIYARIYRRYAFLGDSFSAMLFLLILGTFSFLIRQWCLQRVTFHSHQAALLVSVLFRENLYRQALRLGPEELDDQSMRSAVELFTHQVDGVRYGLENWIGRLARFPLEIGWAVLLTLLIDPLLLVQWAFPVALCLFLIVRAATRMASARRLADDRLRDEFRALSQQMLNTRLIRGYGMEQLERQEFTKRIQRTLTSPKDLFPTQREALWLQRLTFPMCAVMAMFLCFSMGMRLLRESRDLSFAGAVAFLIAVFLILRGTRELWNLKSVKDGLTLAADQIFRFLDRTPTVSQTVGAKFINPLERTLHFETVSYQSTSQQSLLDKVTLKLEARKSYAIVSLDDLEAKSFTLLLPRFIEPQAGRILFDGEDIASATLESLRAEVMYVGGNDTPFKASVLENLQAGNSKFTLQQATDVAKLTHAHSFLMRLSQGYETQLSSDGSELDPSQRFRLSLSRAVLHNPAVLIIEEPRIPFDDDVKQLMDDAYQRITPQRTVFFLPTRLSTLKRADQVIVLHNGQVAAQGPQSVLINSSPLYRHWEYLHFNEFRRGDGERSNGSVAAS